MVDAFEVIYMTGAPAAGKSTLSERLRGEITPLEVFNYGQELAKYLGEKSGEPLHQDELRAQSARLITPEDVVELDAILLEKARLLRASTHLLIDTHAVTKEEYGFRVTPFSLAQLAGLRPTKIVVLYTSPELAIERIGQHAGGRPIVTPFESALHTALQATVAVSYGTSLGIPIYFLDSAKPLDELVEWFRQRVGRKA